MNHSLEDHPNPGHIRRTVLMGENNTNAYSVDGKLFSAEKSKIKKDKKGYFVWTKQQ